MIKAFALARQKSGHAEPCVLEAFFWLDFRWLLSCVKTRK